MAKLSLGVASNHPQAVDLWHPDLPLLVAGKSIDSKLEHLVVKEEWRDSWVTIGVGEGASLPVVEVLLLVNLVHEGKFLPPGLHLFLPCHVMVGVVKTQFWVLVDVGTIISDFGKHDWVDKFFIEFCLVEHALVALLLEVRVDPLVLDAATDWGILFVVNLWLLHFRVNSLSGFLFVL